MPTTLNDLTAGHREASLTPARHQSDGRELKNELRLQAEHFLFKWENKLGCCSQHVHDADAVLACTVFITAVLMGETKVHFKKLNSKIFLFNNVIGTTLG